MRSFQEVKKEFMRIYEGIAGRRGLPAIIGRIMAAFFIEERELNQRELSDITGYSLSSVSRALDQMVRMGLVTKYKEPSRECFVYRMKTDFSDLAIGGLETWIRQAEIDKSEIENLRKKIENLTFREEEEAEAKHLYNVLKEIEKKMELLIEIIREDVEELRKRKI